MARKKTSKLKKILNKYGLLILGILVLISSFSYKYYRVRVLSFKGEIQNAQTSGKRPVNIAIDSLNINFPVEEGYISNDIWSIPKESAAHLSSSANPGTKGNIVIYAHNKNNAFGPIRWIKKETEIKLINEDKSEFYYLVTDIKEVKPSEIQYVLPKSEETLTLYTCSGFADLKRFIVIAKPKT